MSGSSSVQFRGARLAALRTAPARRAVPRTLAAVLAAALGIAVLVGAAPAQAAVGDIGYPGWSTTGASQPPSADKPESKLWYAQGRWWGVLWNSTTLRFTIAWLDRSTQTWTDTGTVVDTRANTLADVLWDGTHLFVASHVVTVSTDTSPVASKVNQPARLMRYTFQPASGTYTADAGFPTQISNNSSESLTIDKDSVGRVWATWTQVAAVGTGFTNTVYTNVSSPDGTAWGTPTPVPAAGATVAPDDISSVVSFGGNRIGVLWSNQSDGNFYWAVRNDSQPVTTWTTGVAAGGTSFADDHLSLKSLQSDAAGRVFAVVKTSLNDTGAAASSPQVVLLSFAAGAWSSAVVWTVGDCPTRPIAMLDDEHQTVHVIATAPNTGCPFSGSAGTIFEKTAPLSNPTFTAGRGTPVIRDTVSPNLNDVTSSKQSVNGTTGLVLLATNQVTKRYWHNDLVLATPTAPTASFTAGPVSGVAPVTTQFTDTSTGTPTSWSWSFGDGTTSTAQNPSHTYAAPGTYTVSLTAANALGSSTSTRTGLVSVTAPSSGIVFRGATTGSNATATTVTLPAVTSATAGDVLLAAVTVRGNPTLTPPAGWTLVRLDANGTTGRTAVYWHAAATTDPTSWTWALSQSQAAAGVVAGYGGVSATNPVDVSAGQVNASSTSVTAPSVTTTVANDRVVALMSTTIATTLTPAAGATELAQVSTPATKFQVTLDAEDLTMTTPGATGALVATAAKGSASIGQQVALRPAG